MAIECKTALERLLEADPAELRGEGEGDLAAHVRDCERCAAVAERLLAEQAGLAAALDQLAPRIDVDAALDGLRDRRVRAQRWRRRWRIAAPLAAAAALAGLLLFRPRLIEREFDPARHMPGELVSRPSPVEPLVEAPAAKNVLVFETKDQSAKVIWFY